MNITLEAIRAAGGIVHSDGNIFFRDISMLQGLAGAAPAAVAGPANDLAELAMLNKLIELGAKASYAHAKSNSDDGPAGTAAYVQWQELRAEMGELIRAHKAPALEAPPAVAPQGEYPHEQMDAMALARYKVVPSHASMLWSHAVVAGDGAQQLYVGREVECQNMARKFAGAFLDGAFAFHSMAAKAHDWRENASYGGEICAECGAAKGSRRGNAPCAWPPEPLDVCTDPYNCARCKAHPNHRKGLEHAGISRPRSAAQAKEGGEAA